MYFLMAREEFARSVREVQATLRHYLGNRYVASTWITTTGRCNSVDSCAGDATCACAKECNQNGCEKQPTI